MTKDPGSQYTEPIQEMRRLARERFGNPDELQQLRGESRQSASRSEQQIDRLENPLW
jgi:hypothetical protein